MPSHNTQPGWGKYRERALAAITPMLEGLGFELENEQPHIGGERYLMQAVTTASGTKLILLGRRKKDGARVVIKATDTLDGARELAHERKCRRVLQEINFAYRVFLSPEEIFFMERAGYTLSVQAFIDESAFLARPLRAVRARAKAFKRKKARMPPVRP